MAYFEFPHTRTYDSDLGWLIKHFGLMSDQVETLETWASTHKEEYTDLNNKVEGLINNLVDVISPWDSSIAYHIFSIVEYQGTNYIAVQDVPVGAMITNTDYWQPANTVIEQVNAIGVVVDEIKSFSFHVLDTAAEIASTFCNAGDHIYTLGYYNKGDGGAGEYVVNSAGETEPETLQTSNGLYAKLVAGDEVNVVQLGADPTGTADATSIFNYAFENYKKVTSPAQAVYNIADTIWIPYGICFDGNQCEFKITNNTGTGLASQLPQHVAVYVKGKNNISEVEGYTKELKNFKVTDETSITDLIGIYVGQTEVISSDITSTVNISVFGYEFNNILIYGFNVGLEIAEAWQCSFENISIRNFSATGLLINGQSVNNVFDFVCVDGRAENVTGLHARTAYYTKRPEGCLFNNCQFFSCNVGIYLQSSLSFQFSNCMIDLHASHAVQISGGAASVFTNCWMAIKNGNSAITYGTNCTVYLQAIGTVDVEQTTKFIGCSLVNTDSASTYKHVVQLGYNRYGDVFSGCMVNGRVTKFYSNCMIEFIGCSFDSASPMAGGSVPNFIGCVNANDGTFVANDKLA